MARPRKIGLDYFPVDVDIFDDYKITDLLNRYGSLGLTVYLIVVSRVYKNGYYLEIPLDILTTQIVRIIGNKWIKYKDLVLQVMEYCADIGLFDNALLKQSVITSVGIQRRYSEVTVRNKVNKDKYWLLEDNRSQAVSSTAPQKPVSATETHVIVTETPIDATSIPQKESKGNKSKGKESKGNKSVLSIPLKDGSVYAVSQNVLNELQQQFPAVNIMYSLRKLVNYFNNHHDKLKDKNSVYNYMMLWLEDDNNKIQNNQTSVSAENNTHHSSSYDLSFLDGIGLLD